MEAMAQVGIWAAATAFATGLAFLMAWAFLQGTFRLMQPAGAGRIKAETVHRASTPVPRLELAEGTRAALRAFARS